MKTLRFFPWLLLTKYPQGTSAFFSALVNKTKQETQNVYMHGYLSQHHVSNETNKNITFSPFHLSWVR